MTVKYIIEKGLDKWYKSPDLTETSDSMLDAYLFSFAEVSNIMQTHEASFLRVERLTANSDTVVEDLFSAIDQSVEMKDGETWGDYYNGWRTFIREECQDIIDEALSNSSIMEDIEKQCLDEIVKRRSNE